MNRTIHISATLLALILLTGGSALAQEAEDKPLPRAQEDQSSGGAPPAESYLKEQRRKQELEPYQPGRIPGMPEGYDTQESLIPRSGSGLNRNKPQPLPSPLAPLERRRKHRLGQQAVPQPGSIEVTPGPDLATSRFSREGVYRVSYTSGKPNSYGLPFSWRVNIQDKNGMPIKGAHLSMRLSMPKSGHAPVITGMAVRELGNGIYNISGIRCDRAGLWRAVLEVHGRGYGDIVTFNLMVP